MKPKKKELKQDVEKLISLGKSKGYLTYDEVNSTLSDEIDSSEEIDQVFDILDGEDIKVVDAEDESDAQDEAKEEGLRTIVEEPAKEENVYAEKFIPLD